LGQAIVLAPPFIISEAEIADLFSILRRTLDEVYSGISSKAA
jgi:adenosylmethionine-8-amino-7-oxononanoate aminotransferase